jgi:CubicO group peptidase (beta-lactamase class C family)
LFQFYISKNTKPFPQITIQPKKQAIMSYKTILTCRKCSIALVFMLLFQVSFSQSKWKPVDDWMQTNLDAMGGRAVLIVYKDGKVMYSHAENKLRMKQKFAMKFMAKRQGKDASEMTEDFTTTSIQRIASCSKWLSAALVMTFVDEGKLNLEDTIGKYLPVMSQNGKGNIKIKYCLSHLTGIKEPELKESIAEITSAKTMDESMATFSVMPMEGEPGNTFHYSNVGLQICAAIAEKIGGESFESLFEERIAKPCNMANSDYGHVPVALAAGGAWSSAQDYLNFLVMIMHKGMFNGKRVLSEKSVTEMEIDRTKDAIIAYSPVSQQANWHYGFGEWIAAEKNGQSMVVSSPGLFGSFPWINIEKGYCGFLLNFNLKREGREKLYASLTKIVGDAVE